MCEDDPLIPGRVLAVPAPGTLEPRVSTTEACAQAIASGADIGWPSYGRVTSRFGWRIHPIFGTREFHTGVDIASPWGTPVRAAKSGVVRFVGWMIGYGRLIIVDHENGLQTFYGHLSNDLVRAGSRVQQGELIGRVGSTGWSTGPHLFFEIRRFGVPLDPIRLMH
jgi:murein DD-endopeptidase MepM/ murein hydrolase activator NlpD